jgi:hypothetical protein
MANGIVRDIALDFDATTGAEIAVRLRRRLRFRFLLGLLLGFLVRPPDGPVMGLVGRVLIVVVDIDRVPVLGGTPGADAVEVVRRAEHGLDRLGLDIRVVQVRDEVCHHEGLFQFLDAVGVFDLQGRPKGAGQGFALAHFIAEFEKFRPLIVGHADHHVRDDDLLMRHDFDVLAGKLGDADTALIFHVLVVAGPAPDGLPDSGVDVGAFLAGGGHHGPGGEDFDSSRPHELCEALLGQGVKRGGRGLVLIGVLGLFLHINLLVVEVGGDRHGVHHGAVDFRDIRNSLHRHEQVIFLGRVFFGDGEGIVALHRRGVVAVHSNLLIDFAGGV